jgi:hypothetical protein
VQLSVMDEPGGHCPKGTIAIVPTSPHGSSGIYEVWDLQIVRNYKKGAGLKRNRPLYDH